MNAETLPLSDVWVLDFGHTVMGPTAGLILANLGFSPAEIDQLFADGIIGLFDEKAGSIELIASPQIDNQDDVLSSRK